MLVCDLQRSFLHACCEKTGNELHQIKLSLNSKVNASPAWMFSFFFPE